MQGVNTNLLPSYAFDACSEDILNRTKMLQWQSLSECRSTYLAMLYGQVQCRMQGPVCAEAGTWTPAKGKGGGMYINPSMVNLWVQAFPHDLDELGFVCPWRARLRGCATCPPSFLRRYYVVWQMAVIEVHR